MDMKSKRLAAIKKKFKSFITPRNLVIELFCLLFITSTAGAVYFYQKAKILQEETQTLSKDPAVVAQEESQVLVEKIGKLILLPEGELPTVATVTNPEKLLGQPFFVNAKRGDKVLLYTQAKKAYLYDPIDNKLIDVGPLNLTPAASSSSSTTTPFGGN